MKARYSKHYCCSTVSRAKHEHVHLIDNVNSYLHLLIDGIISALLTNTKTLPLQR